MIVDLYTRAPYRGIAIHDNVDRPPAELLAEVFPGVPLTRDVGKSGTLLAIDLLAIDRWPRPAPSTAPARSSASTPPTPGATRYVNHDRVHLPP